MVHRLPDLRSLLIAALLGAVTIALLPHVWLGAGFHTGNAWSRGAAVQDLRPHRLNTEIAGERTGEYQQARTVLERSQLEDDSVVALIDANGSARVFLNNILLTAAGGQDDGDGRVHVFHLPAAYLHEGENVLDVIYPTATRKLRPPLAVITSSGKIQASIGRYLRIDSTIRLVVAISGLVMALLCFVSLSLRPATSEHLWRHGAIALLLTSAAAPSSVYPDSIASSPFVLAFAWTSATVVLIAGLVQAHVSKQRTWAGRARNILAVGAGLSLAIGLGGVFIAQPLQAWPTPAIALGLSLALAYFWLSTLVLAYSGIETTAHYIRQIRDRESVIRHQQDTISHQSEKLEAEIQRRAVSEERERFSRDIHDGLGGSLLSLLVQVRAGRIEQREIENALEANLDELRMMIDSLDQSEQSLNAALSSIQMRIRSLFNGAGIELDWVQPDFRLPDHVSPDFILHLYRILQEAGSNIVRHSMASRAEYRFSWAIEGRTMSISIANDGPMARRTNSNGSGNGLKNMAQRVKEMQGTFEAGPKPDGGWAIQVSLPV